MHLGRLSLRIHHLIIIFASNDGLTWGQLLVLLQSRPYLQTFLEVKESRVFEATVAHEIVKLMPGLDGV